MAQHKDSGSPITTLSDSELDAAAQEALRALLALISPQDLRMEERLSFVWLLAPVASRARAAMIQSGREAAELPDLRPLQLLSRSQASQIVEFVRPALEPWISCDMAKAATTPSLPSNLEGRDVSRRPVTGAVYTVRDAVISVSRDDQGEGSARFLYVVRTPDWEYVNTIDVGEPVGADARLAAEALFAWLYECGLAALLAVDNRERTFPQQRLLQQVDTARANQHCFPEHVAQWALLHIRLLGFGTIVPDKLEYEGA